MSVWSKTIEVSSVVKVLATALQVEVLFGNIVILVSSVILIYGNLTWRPTLYFPFIFSMVGVKIFSLKRHSIVLQKTVYFLAKPI